MRIASILLFGTTLFSSLVNADSSSSFSSVPSVLPEDEPSFVLKLTDDNFDATVTARSLLLVKFYTPWCGYCKALAPEYESAAASLVGLTDKVTMAEVDCSVHEELCMDHDVDSFPTIKLFRQEIPTVYNGLRQADAITRYLVRQTQPPITLLEHGDQDALATLRQSDNIVVVGSGSTLDTNFAYTTFKILADEWRDRYTFGWVASATPRNGSEDNHHDNADNNNGSHVTVYTRFDDQDDQVDVYSGDLGDIDNLKTFIRQHATPLFGPIGPDTYMDYEDAALPLAYLFIDSIPMLASFHDSMVALAQHHRGKINFVYIDATAYPEQADYLGINTTTASSDDDDRDNDDDKGDGMSVWPAFVIQDPEYNRYVLPQTTVINDKAIKDHLSRFLDHTLIPFLLSDPVPDTPNEGPVQKVVGLQFHDLVTSSDRDVLLKVYAPWCGHCKALAPIWQQLGELVHNQSYPLRVASMDGTSNDMPPNDPAAFDVDAFPTIAFIEAHTHRVALYSADDDRSLAGLVNFIHEQRATSTDNVVLQLPVNDVDDDNDNDRLEGSESEDNIKEDKAEQQQETGNDIKQSSDDDDLNDNNASANDDQIRVSQVHDEL